MAHGIVTIRDFVYGKVGQGNDWHGLTVEKENLSPEMFPNMEAQQLQTFQGVALPWKVLISTDDNQPCGSPFNPDSFGYILPQAAWEMVEQAIAGTHYTVERIGMLWDRSFWFVSISLDELKAVSRPGEMFRLNFSGGLDGANSPQGELSHIRAVCWNTISASRRTNDYLFKIRQTTNSGSKLDAAKAEVEKAVGMAKIFNTTLAALEQIPCNIDTARAAYAGDVAARGGDFRIAVSKKTGQEKESKARNLVDEFTELFRTGAGNSGKTRADVLNGYTQLLTRGRKDSKKNVWTQVASSEFGGNADRKSEFLTTLADSNKFDALVARGKEALATTN
jgi:hypothetical protein